MTEFEMKCYGMSKDDIDTQYAESITAKVTGLEMVVAGILSDCQEMIAMKNATIPHPAVDEQIRKQLNVAKYLLFKMMDEKETA